MWGRVGGEPESEVWVGGVWVELLADLLQHRHPGHGKVAVLKHRPRAFFFAGFDHAEGNRSLALPER